MKFENYKSEMAYHALFNEGSNDLSYALELMELLEL